MVYRRPRPEWLKAVIVNKDPVPKARSRAKLKVYLGDLQPINWYDLLRALKFSADEPALLAPVQPVVMADTEEKVTLSAQAAASEAISWRDLVAEETPPATQQSPKQANWFLLPWQEVLTPRHQTVDVAKSLSMKPNIHFQYVDNNPSWTQSFTLNMRWQGYSSTSEE
jgi:hypothetical protein